MLREKSKRLGVAALLVAGAALAGGLIPQPSTSPQERRITMTARQYAYDPPTLKVNQGDTIRLRIESTDVLHGFYLEGYSIDAKIIPESPYLELANPGRPNERTKKVEEIVFVADRTGKFRYRCSHTCGTMHPFMNGELVVEPNRLFGAGVGSFVGLLLAGGLLSFWGGRKPTRESSETSENGGE